jgi:uncharacterized protein (UPF0332 family)
VKVQTGTFLDKAGGWATTPEAMLRIDLHEAAGRTAYLAGFHAVQALIIEISGHIYKSHSGVHGEFSRLVKEEPHVDGELRAFLGRTYSFKAIADYETGPVAHISAENAREAIDWARRFIECVAGLMPEQR